ncbi:class I SAM-dependent methyltransferase [Streptomyces tubbatahanensis]|uniref:Class I SAM-dependent methyltransferase n=1 Tax=Streptomyces tubbatahanensis TaxID=2923272 RepID=A0ABY3XKV2_9ACTN|nr:class I SAM-dependent methyltransferase [Streptomyces tubbatahanensis]UNS95034.1 class I SAM-dependent methyltransferase [Streptomyces tubbatahanensis]
MSTGLPLRVAVQLDPTTDDGARTAPRRAAEMDCLGPARGSVVLDLMCGVGQYARLLPPRTRYLGVDHDPEMIQVARGRLRAGHGAVVGDAARVPLRSGSADHVLLTYEGLNSFRRAEQRHRVLGEVSRCLRPGGTALVDLWRPFEHPGPDADRTHVTPRELAVAAEAVGLKVTGCERLHAGATSDKAETRASGQFLLRRTPRRRGR